MPVADGNVPVRTLMIHEWHSERLDQDRTWDAERETGMAKATVQRIGHKLGYTWEKNTENTQIVKPEDLPTPREFNQRYKGFPKLISIDGGKPFPYYEAHSVAARMNAIGCKAEITWQKASIIRNDPEYAALDLDRMRKGKPVVSRLDKPRKEGNADINKVKVGWNGLGNPPGWTRKEFAYPLLKQMGYTGDFNILSNTQILDMIEAYQGSTP